MSEGAETLLLRNARRWPLGRGFDPSGELAECSRRDIAIVSGGALPDLLRSIADPPELLYLRGRPDFSAPALAIVGSRRPTSYGRRMARALAADCAKTGIVVVSGLARGIDTEAHEEALRAGGRSWAVLGCGIDQVYPPENSALAQRLVAAGGAVLSELPLGAPPAARNFPLRNRIVSGLSWGCVVVEGDLRSGSLITARLAAEQGREVFAVPGPADSALSAGPHALIRSGAGLVTCLAEIIEALPALAGYGGRLIAPPPGQAAHSQEEEKILELLGSEAMSLEELVGRTPWGLTPLLHILAKMETRGLIRPEPGQRYARI